MSQKKQEWKIKDFSLRWLLSYFCAGKKRWISFFKFFLLSLAWVSGHSGAVFAQEGRPIPFQLRQQGPVQKISPRQFSGQVEQQLFQESNAVRQKQGLEILKQNDLLQEVARNHSEDMLKRNYLSHVSPEGKAVADRVQLKVKKLQTDLGENLHMISAAQGLYDAAAVAELMVSDWMNSKPHRENILAKKFTQLGVGCVSDGRRIYCTQVFSGPGL